MLITDDFCFIHIPKSGGTFVLAVMEDLYAATRTTKNTCIVYESKDISGIVNGHNYASHIPIEHRSLPVLSTIRNPFDRYASFYTYEYNEKLLGREYFDHKFLLDHYENYPNISFRDYLHLIVHYERDCILSKRFNVEVRADIGLYSIHFILAFFIDPIYFLKNASDDDILSIRGMDDVKHLTYDTHFLRVEELNRDLFGYLIAKGWPHNEAARIFEYPKINRGKKRNSKPWKTYYSEEFLNEVRYKEAPAFSAFLSRVSRIMLKYATLKQEREMLFKLINSWPKESLIGLDDNLIEKFKWNYHHSVLDNNVKAASSSSSISEACFITHEDTFNSQCLGVKVFTLYCAIRPGSDVSSVVEGMRNYLSTIDFDLVQTRVFGENVRLKDVLQRSGFHYVSTYIRSVRVPESSPLIKFNKSLTFSVVDLTTNPLSSDMVDYYVNFSLKNSYHDRFSMDINVPPSKASERFQKILENAFSGVIASHLVIARLDSKLIGLCFFSVRPSENFSIAGDWLTVFVDKPYRSANVGTQLVGCAINSTSDSNTYWWSNNHVSNAASTHGVGKLGFRSAAITHDFHLWSEYFQ